MSQTATPPTAQEILEQVKHKYGFVPNVLREMSASPAALQVYVTGQDALAKGSLSAIEQQAVQVTVAAHNACEYCQAAHSWIGQKVGITPKDLEAIKTGTRPQNTEVAGIVEAARALLERRGWLAEEQLRALEESGVTRAKLYEVIAFIGLKTMSNYVNHIAHTPIDDAFQT